MKFARCVFCLLMGLASVATGGSQESASTRSTTLDQLARAEAKWRASKVDAYEFRLQPACNGLISPTPPGEQSGPLFRVKDGEGTLQGYGVRAPVPAGVSSDHLVQYSTVERLFAFVRKAWAARPSKMDVQYDHARGYPVRVCVNPAGAVPDDEFGFLLTEFKVLSNLGGEQGR